MSPGKSKIIDPPGKKTCRSCLIVKDLDDFYRHPQTRDGKGSYCKDCNRERSTDYMQKRTQELRGLVRSAKERPCADCGVQYPYYVMQFDHRDPRDKDFRVSQFSRNLCNRDKLEAEIAKCDVVCANCHMERTHQQRESGVLVPFQSVPGRQAAANPRE